jgi:hypothetical protein
VINEEKFMVIRALSRQSYTYAEIGRMVGRDWRTMKRYLEHGAQPVYRRRRMLSKLDPSNESGHMPLGRSQRQHGTRRRSHPRPRPRP